MEKKGLVLQLGRGLYQLADAPLDANHSLADAAKLVPRGVICLDSALAFHELTDRIPSRIWVAIGFREWRPRITQPPIESVRFAPKRLTLGVKEHVIEGVTVRICEPAKTIVDLFYQAFRTQSPGTDVRIEDRRHTGASGHEGGAPPSQSDARRDRALCRTRRYLEEGAPLSRGDDCGCVSLLATRDAGSMSASL